MTLPHGTFNTPAFMPVGTQVRELESEGWVVGGWMKRVVNVVQERWRFRVVKQHCWSSVRTAILIIFDFLPLVVVLVVLVILNFSHLSHFFGKREQSKD